MILKQKLQSFKQVLFLFILAVIGIVLSISLSAIFYLDFLLVIGLSLFFFIIYLIVYYRRYQRKYSTLQLRNEELTEEKNLLESDVQTIKKQISSFQQKISDYATLKVIIEQLLDSTDIAETTHLLADGVTHIFRDENLTIIVYLFQRNTEELGMKATKRGKLAVNLKAKNGDLYDQWVVTNMTSLIVKDTHNDYRFDLDQNSAYENREIGSVMAIPLISNNNALGILRVDHPKANQFEMDALRILGILAQVGSVAIENAQLVEQIKEYAIKDSLTGLYLKRHLQQRLSEEILRQMKVQSSLSFIMIDVDFFKKFNDQYGHKIGDLVLKHLAKLMKKVFNQTGAFKARYGGEEFSVFLPDVDKKQATQLSKEFCELVAETPLVVRRKKYSFTVSVGLASFPKDAKIKDDLIMKADQALYEAKKNGRNQVRVAE